MAGAADVFDAGEKRVLNERNRRPELMDASGLDPVLHHQALAGLRRVNWISRTGTILWRALQPFLAGRGSEPLKVLDVACGGGDVALALARHAHRADVALDIVGCDLSPTSVAYARRIATEQGFPTVRFVEANALALGSEFACDVATCTLFMHHLECTEACQLLRSMAGVASRGILLDDLERTTLGYCMAWCGARLLSRSPVVHFDGPVSVAGAFSIVEARQIASEAGLTGAHIRRHWPERFLLEWSRP